MQISQRSINFGSREVKSRTEKTLVIDNRSALPLLYKVSKPLGLGLALTLTLTLTQP